MSDKPKPTPPIRGRLSTGKIEFIQTAAGEILLRFHGKSGTVETPIDAGQLERWAMRQMRDGIFA